MFKVNDYVILNLKCLFCRNNDMFTERNKGLIGRIVEVRESVLPYDVLFSNGVRECFKKNELIKRENYNSKIIFKKNKYE